MQDSTFIGLDVHKATISVAVARGERGGEVRHRGTVPHRPDHVRKLVEKLAAGGARLQFRYEAGPCGYGLHRHIEEMGHDCIVVAPSLIPVKAGDRVKTDRRDAVMLAKLHRAGAVLCFMGHALMENRHGFVVQGDLTQADGHAERKAALHVIHRHFPGSTRQLTLGADKGYDAAGFVADLRQASVTPHVAQKSRYSAIDGRTTRHERYALTQKHRKRVEEPFGWAKTVGGMAQTMYRGVERVRSRFVLTMATNNLVRLPRLLGA